MANTEAEENITCRNMGKLFQESPAKRYHFQKIIFFCHWITNVEATAPESGMQNNNSENNNKRNAQP